MPERNKNWFEAHPKSAGWLIGLVLLVAIEFFVRAAASLDFWEHHTYPITAEPTFWSDLDRGFGAWHYPDVEFLHKSSCFEVRYRSNSYGARDRERSTLAEGRRRFVVLGDSYAEGWGVDDEDRVTDVLEAATGIEFLNFASAGHGSIQEWLLYERFGDQFEHSDVIILMLPDNDFADNDPAYFAPTQYRPYLRRVGDDFEVYYTTSWYLAYRRGVRSQSRISLNRLLNRLYTANLVFGFATRRPAPQTKAADRRPYDDFSEEGLEVLLHTYRKIREAAGVRNVYLFTIPRHRDFEQYLESGYDFRIVAALSDFADRFDNFYYRDLMPEFVEHLGDGRKPYKRFFLPCNAHWSPLGHRIAADAIGDLINAQPPQ